MKIWHYFYDLLHRMKCVYSYWKYLSIFSNNKQDAEPEVCFALLRKNCHILDKGLYTVPFEIGHGKCIYNEALSLRKKIIGTALENDPSFLWCESVINDYILAQHKSYAGKQNKSFHIYNDQEKEIIYDFLYSRVSCRNFNLSIIEDNIWNEIITIAADAPNGCCRQTTRVYIVHNEATIEKLKPSILGMTGFNQVPYLLCITADTRPFYTSDRMFPYIDASLFVENLILACRANNIFATILNFQYASQKHKATVAEILNIPRYETTILFIAAGKVDGIPEKPSRMAVKQFRKM